MRLSCVLMGLMILCAVSERPCPGQSPATTVELTVTPAESPAPSHALRLLPTAPELKDGNAAVVMLRMIWEQHRMART